MASNRRSNPGQDAQLPVRRPIRPFLTGTGIAAVWGAYHIPGTGSLAGLGEFAAELLALAIGTGGTIAILVEMITFIVATCVRWKIWSNSSSS